MNIRIDIAATVAQLHAQAARVRGAQEAGLDRCATVTLNAKRRTVARTYRRSIPRSKTGRARWNRGGDLLNGQTIESRTGERIIITVGPAAKYEGRLANLPTGADGINRSYDHAGDAHRIVEPQIGVAFEQEFRNHLGI